MKPHFLFAEFSLVILSDMLQHEESIRKLGVRFSGPRFRPVEGLWQRKVKNVRIVYLKVITFIAFGMDNPTGGVMQCLQRCCMRFYRKFIFLKREVGA